MGSRVGEAGAAKTQRGQVGKPKAFEVERRVLTREQQPRDQLALDQCAGDGRKLDRFGTRADDERNSAVGQSSP